MERDGPMWRRDWEEASFDVRVDVRVEEMDCRFWSLDARMDVDRWERDWGSSWIGWVYWACGCLTLSDSDTDADADKYWVDAGEALSSLLEFIFIE